MNYYIGIDSGGTFMKAALFNAKGEQQGLARVSASVINEKQGWVERDLDALWGNAVAVIKQLLETTQVEPTDIKGLSISAQGKGVYLLDKQGKNLGHGIMSSDSRSLPIVKEWLEQGKAQEIYPTTLQTLWTGHPVSIIRWVKENDRQRYDQIGAVMMSHDYLRYRLTGEVAAELTNISESNFFNSITGEYDKALLKTFGIEEIWDALPPVVKPQQQAGKITAAIAEETGLALGTPVFGGLFDVVSTAICSGINSSEDTLNYVMGTWAVTSGISKQVTQETHNFVYGHYAVDGEYIIHEASPTSAGNYEWFADYLGEDGKLDHAQNQALVDALDPASSSVYFVPFLYGSNQGLGLKSGFYGLQSHHTKSHLIQAIWEGILFCHNLHLERMRQRFPKADVLKVTGGPASSPVWMQMLADLTGMTVEVSDVDETGSLGAAMMAMVGAGEFASLAECTQSVTHSASRVEPNPANYEKYQKKYKHYQRLVQLFKQFEEEMDA
ncbi:L-xylulose kinase [Vibrio chagasii]|uniref:FGGY-family carbohydrate kinase n=1 Tax=Vibrio TaxID=662 RepID=UPI000CF364F9|nr:MULTISPECIES: FGGY-family carbohydrate kinase [Vibrio]MCG9673519.1 carbohydrate kinase [Vibrio chagasii]NOI93404.1 carbohydrate kinase [Vibrio sp. T3Y01]PQJ51474.1 carbohydrate kinase [Vibrio splendidus]CAH6844995.1 L-xylulose kinase [Vibrio chagasii]CAH6846865.1 L-xylulose kinase [Vibrio chagasii]